MIVKNNAWEGEWGGRKRGVLMLTCGHDLAAPLHTTRLLLSICMHVEWVETSFGRVMNEYGEPPLYNAALAPFLSACLLRLRHLLQSPCIPRRPLAPKAPLLLKTWSTKPQGTNGMP